MVGSFRSETSSSAMKTSSFPPLDGWNSICGRDHNHIGFHTRQRIFSVVVKFTIDSFFHSISGLHSDAIQCCLLCVWRAYLLLFLVLFFSKEYSIQNSSIHSMLNDVLYTNIYYFFSIKINDISTESSGRRPTQSHLHCHLNIIEREKKATNIFFGIMCARASKL